MKKIISTITMLCLALVINAQTQLSFSAKSGDKELDLTLSNMNTDARANLSVFKSDLSVSFGVTTTKIDKLLVTMQPAEVYLTLQIGKIVNKPVDDLVVIYNKHKGKGWGVIAKEMGIKPGSKEFHALKGKAKDKGNKVKENKGKGNSDKGNSGKEKSEGKGNSGGGKGKGKK